MASEQQIRLAEARADGQASADSWTDATNDSIDSVKNTASNAADSVRETASNAADSVRDTAGSVRDGTCEAASVFADSVKETGSNAAQWGREKTDSIKESIDDTTFAAREKKEFAAGFIEQRGENVKQAFIDADESMKQGMEADTSIPGTTSLDRTNTPSFDQFC